ncbi:AfsR/SARP family transcriptional regulator [Streptomyces sp. SID13666]|uniref:AfsR/SARP family transcriptional regulator n=1 Tax=unclassified Streptomyces TaxID=2593676 RepID=UPI0013C26355|nr:MULTISPECIES: AfsR/SARP family transcriptional regulator [unclassified Streptomyces]NEA56251.1 AfsR/SARP family transcriptional regulator [Streptomyces sp. SID13666]NEA71922.1 AfsR/SARP family transcriptional regulator [Streptomyces sp. SID13588]
MQFAVLGQVEVWDADRLIEVERPQRRAVLAYLLLNAGQSVTLDRLIDAIWADDAPASARTQIHSAVSALRQTLRGTDPENRIQTTTDGYLCTVGEDELDLAVFRTRVRHAATEIADRRSAQALESLRAALGLWRGSALSGVNAAFVEPARARLHEERLDAWQQLAACGLDLGQESELVPMLTELVEANPQREQLVGQLLIALYRTGRQADAIERYAETRRFLADELGLDPSPELSAIHVAILRADRALATAAMNSALGAAVPPAASPHPPQTDDPAADSVTSAPAPAPRRPWRRPIRLALAGATIAAVAGTAIAIGQQGSGASHTPTADAGTASHVRAQSLPIGPLAPVRVYNVDGDCKSQSERLPACRMGLAKDPHANYEATNVVAHHIWHGDVLMADCMVTNGVRIEDEHGVGTPNWFRVHLTDVPGGIAWLPAVRTHDDPQLATCPA